MGKEAVREAIEASLKKSVLSNEKLKNVYLLVHSDRHDIHWNMAYGRTGDNEAHPDQSYHTASIGKTFTAVLIALLAEKGLLNMNDKIIRYLPEEVTAGLHVYKDKDYTSDITIEHLLAHTSGLPDFYEEKPKNGKRFIELLLEEPGKEWTALDTVRFSKEYLGPKFEPGKRAHYTNYGYNLLGLIIENVTKMEYSEALHHYLFTPLSMDRTYLSQYSKPAQESVLPDATIVLANRETVFSECHSFKSIYAGGQTVSTSEDLLTFMKALREGRILKEETLASMQSWQKRLTGIDLGQGLMRIRMLPFTDKYTSWGHLGSIASFMLYNPQMDAYVIGNFNNNSYVRQGIQFAFKTYRHLAKLEKKVESM
ncbi:serine hydrolase [Bacillus sp. FJAT-27225]|uniref:serine hydrolase domain-containing protein n=1 Tax=Bacillus sp. FJAT-27225 TaxID=1743144 RepID=UPI00080C2751|nr:serine hydrolase domain-containing protein [Bacillus sp. FJAT-27225]OCA85927.1 serine hydrolase [Bacillus sp. FJAT-27225]